MWRFSYQAIRGSAQVCRLVVAGSNNGTERCHGVQAVPARLASTGAVLPALQAFRTAAKTTSQAHEKATGFPNDALVSYIQAVQQQAGCPAKAS